MTPDEYCQDKASKSGSSFYYAFLFLPKPRRRAITALYAYCREVDDVVDECSDPQLARVKLGWWRNEVEAMYAGKPTHPVTKALEPHLQAYQLKREHVLAIIDGMQMDLDQSRYLDFKGLERYCWHVAGVVGMLSASIFGYTDPRTLQYAEKLGLAFQMTNIIRDVGDDIRMGRIYLPVDELQRFDVKAHEINTRQYSDRFAALMKFQTERAQALYDEAFALLPAADRKTQRPGLMMAAIYRQLLIEIEDEKFQVLTQRISLPPLRKLWLAWKVWVFG